MKLTPFVRLLRPKQWTKNLLVFAALIFAHQYEHLLKVELSVVAFFALCMFSSSVYALNDVLDQERDRAHPVKKSRPVASGEMSATQGLLAMAYCLVIGALLAAFVGPSFLAGLLGYLLLQIVYNFWLKRAAVIDVILISTGFVMRAALGAVAIDASISGWLLFCTGALALLLASAKRRHEFHLLGDVRGESRASLLGYTGPSLDAMVVFSAAVAAISYGIYAIESETARQYPSLVLTVPFVFFGIIRYMFLTFAREEGGEPESVLLGDAQMVSAVVLFLFAAFYALSGFDIPFLSMPVRG